MALKAYHIIADDACSLKNCSETIFALSAYQTGTDFQLPPITSDTLKWLCRLYLHPVYTETCSQQK